MTLEDLFEAPQRCREKPYALNAVLGLAPWMPPAVQVWTEACPPDASAVERTRWAEVRTLLDNLHSEHLTRTKPTRGKRTKRRPK
jgi:hypothetical protein